MAIFERISLHGRPRRSRSAGYTVTELMVVTTIILALAATASAAISAATASHKKLRTRTLIAKLDALVANQFAQYANRNVDDASNADRGQLLRSMAEADLPDDWSDVATLATKPTEELTRHQLAYVEVWKSITNQAAVKPTNASAECLFMIVMQGGIADCLDCRGLRAEIGDQDGDGMPEFLDAWGSPVGFVLWPTGLRLPAWSATPFFTDAQPFDAVVPSIGTTKGGLMRPLIYSAGPDRIAGIGPVCAFCGGEIPSADSATCPHCQKSCVILGASPLPGATEHADNITNFDDEAKR